MPETVDIRPQPAPDLMAALRASLRPDRQRIAAVLADLEHVRAKAGTTHHDACWDEHIGCLAARIRRTLTGEDHHV